MTTARVFIAQSLDGHIARRDGSLDWLDRNTDPGEDYGYEAFIASVDGIIMGRVSYETVLGFDIDWPYRKPVWVLSRQLAASDLPDRLAGKVRLLADSPGEVLARAAAEGWASAYVDGGQLIQSFLAEGLIAEMIVTTIPVLLGGGPRLFGTLDRDLLLTHLATRSWPSGLVQSQYRVGS